VLGELSYFIRARVGLAHCALCDITHEQVRERADWRACRERLPVPVAMFHRDDQPPAVRDAAGARAPVMVAETSAGDPVVLANGDQLERCDGSPERLTAHIESSAGERARLAAKG